MPRWGRGRAFEGHLFTLSRSGPSAYCTPPIHRLLKKTFSGLKTGESKGSNPPFAAIPRRAWSGGSCADSHACAFAFDIFAGRVLWLERQSKKA